MRFVQKVSFESGIECQWLIPNSKSCLSLSGRRIEIHGRIGWRFRFNDLAKLRLIPFNIVCQSHHQSLGVLRREDDARFDFCLRHVWGHHDEIKHKLGVVVGNNRKVGVLALGNVLW